MRSALVVSLLLAIAVPAQAGPSAGEQYAAAYRFTGFKLRAATVCPGHKTEMVDEAFENVTSPDFKLFAQSYPQTIEKWMGEGAGSFNAAVMKYGVSNACSRLHWHGGG